MGHKKLIWQLYPSYLVVTLTAMIAVTGYCAHYFRHVYYEHVRSELNQFANLAAEEIHMVLVTEGPDKLDSLCKRLGRVGGGEIRLTVIQPSGQVVGDSHENPAAMGNHSGRPEIIAASQTGSGSSVRFSPTLGNQMMYVAVAVRPPADQNESESPPGIDTPPMVVRVATPLTEIDRALSDVYVNIWWGGLVIAVGAAAVSLLISRRISQPIVSIQQTAERFAAGELDLRVPTPASAELAALADSFNKMAIQLGERITTITEQRNKLDAVLASMAEGVFAVDTAGRVVSVNTVAADLLGIDPAQAQGRHVEEVIRHADLREFVRQTLVGIQPAETDILLPINDMGTPNAESGVGDWVPKCEIAHLGAPAGRSFRLHGACLTDARGRRGGAVVVLNDMTRIRQLETIRRDFVANVSHELKTPVTSIQGFVEALVEGEVKDPGQVEKYLNIVARHASRLNAIIDDLLTLSRLEEAGEGPQMRNITFGNPERGVDMQDSASLRFTSSLVRPVLEEAISLSGVKAEEKRMTIDLTCDGGIEARINPPLLEQAVINLIDNAVKYSPEGSRVRVEVSKRDAGIVIVVQDEGCGISQEHLPRIFERFYVVDKSRSRKLGGTGLGLAIVKHIAQTHGGRVSVESTLGKGSTFTIYLPAE